MANILGGDFLPKAIPSGVKELGDSSIDRIVTNDMSSTEMINRFVSDSINSGTPITENGMGTVLNKITNGISAAEEFVSSGLQNFDLASAGQKIKEGAEKLIGQAGSMLGFSNVAEGLSKDVLGDFINGLPGMNGNPLQAEASAVSTQFRSNLDDVIITLESTVANERLRFAASPRISESRHANYSEVNITHHPGSILKYEKTNSRTWSVGVKLVSRTPGEAQVNQYYLNIIRSWVLPYYGAGTEAEDKKMLGAPPPVLMFSGYGAKNISPIPVVLESYDTSWPNDVDYIPTLEGQPFPVILELNLTLKESYSPREYSNFNLYEYKTGNLAKAFATPPLKSVEEIKGSGKSNNEVDTSQPMTDAEIKKNAQEIFSDRDPSTHNAQVDKNIKEMEGSWQKELMGPNGGADQMLEGGRLLGQATEFEKTGNYPPEAIAAMRAEGKAKYMAGKAQSDAINQKYDKAITELRKQKI